MIGDARDVEAGCTLSADICIVGTGAAGMSLALALLDTKLRVLLLESGGEAPEAATQALYEGAVADEKLHSPTVNYRRRGFGGSTAIWGGRCVPFDPIDFEARSWIPHSGWPFDYAALVPWYAEANALCEAGYFAYDVETAFARGLRPLLTGFSSADFTTSTLERFSCPTDFGKRYRARIAHSANLTLLLHANVTNIRTKADGATVDRLDVRTLGGKDFRVTAKQVVLAVGGMETPRLLLAARDDHATGLGNAHDQVGRYYMCHIAGTLGQLRLEGAARVWHGYDVSDEGIYCRRRLALTEAAQRRMRAGNFIARLHHPRIPDPSHRTGALSALYFAKPFISFEYGKRLHGSGRLTAADWARHVRNLALDPHGAAAFLWHWGRKRSLAARKYPTVIVAPRAQIYSLDFNAEQQPNPASRITLTSERDRIGMQRILVDWRHVTADIDTVRMAFASLAADLAASGCGTLSYDADEVEISALRDGAYGGHHIGTARMSADPRRGVVDAQCRVHGMTNLYIAGSAVFPTSSQANPTLTTVALSLRLAALLKRSAFAEQPLG